MIKKMIMDETRLKEVLELYKIGLPETEFKEVLDRVNGVLRMCDEMQELNFANTRSFEWNIKKACPRRVDSPKKWDKRDAFLNQAPVRDGDFFRVPRIIALDEDNELIGD